MKLSALVAFCAAGSILAGPGQRAVGAVHAVAPTHRITVTEFHDLPGVNSYVATCVASGPDHALWTIEGIDQDSGTPDISEIAVNGRVKRALYFQENSYPSAIDITAGPDNAVWFTDQDTLSLDRFSADGKFSQFFVQGYPGYIALGRDAGLWFTMYRIRGGEEIARITPSGFTQVFSKGLSPIPGLSDIAPGTDNAMWFTEASANRVGRIDLQSHTITEFATGISANAGLNSIAPGADGNMWFTEYKSRRIGRITVSGVVTEYSVPQGAAPNDIAAGPDGAMWFTQDHPAGVARIDAMGRITEFRGVSSGSSPGCIVEGPDSNMWFTEFDANRMARVNLH